jgi:hypothetical protein
MKNLTRINLLIIVFCATTILLFANPLNSTAERQSGSTNLEGTKWLGNTVFHPHDEIFGNYFYVFTKDGKVEFHLVVMVFGPSPLQPLTDSINHDTRLITDPFYLRHNYLTHVDHFSEVGTYEQKGDTLHMHFSAHEIDANISDKAMTGTLRFTGVEKRTEDWKATKLSEEGDILSADVNLRAKASKDAPEPKQ